MAAKKKKRLNVNALYERMEDARMDRMIAVLAAQKVGGPVPKGSLAEFSLKRRKGKGKPKDCDCDDPDNCECE